MQLHCLEAKEKKNRETKSIAKNLSILLMLEQMHIRQPLSFQQMCEQPQKQIPPSQDNK